MRPDYEVTYKPNDAGNMQMTVVESLTGIVTEIEFINGKIDLESLTEQQLAVLKKLYELLENEENINTLIDGINPN